VNSFHETNQIIFNYSKEKLETNKMGTTCSAILLKDKQVYIVHIGDSRIYRIRNKEIEQLTHDHTAVNEMYRKGILSKEEVESYPNKSALARAIGVEQKIKVEIIDNLNLRPNDYFILCTDGLSKISKNEIKRIVTLNPPDNACKILVDLANKEGGLDNVTVQVIKLREDKRPLYSFRRNAGANSRIKRIGIGILVLICLIAFIYFIFVKRETNSSAGINPEDLGDTSLINEPTQSLAQKEILYANKLFEEGNLDSSIIIFRKILQSNPLNLDAVDKVNIIYNEYLNNAEYYMSVKLFKNALEYYQRANEIKPNDEQIMNIISYCKERIENDSSSAVDASSNKITTQEKDNFTDGVPDNTDSGKNYSLYDSSYWQLDDLNSSDYKFGKNGIAFFDSPVSKKIISKNSYNDIEIMVEIGFSKNGLLGNNGLIVGYNRNRENNIESYFSISINDNNELKLAKHVANISSLIFSTTQNITSKDIIELKIKCLGPWIMLYFDGNLLKAWLNDNIIYGKIGLFSSRNSSINFSKLSISKRTSVKNNNK
jgi:tetratricopeptide (TPR) repeat protein